jgi:hypothetical protein
MIKGFNTLFFVPPSSKSHKNIFELSASKAISSVNVPELFVALSYRYNY